MITPVRCYSCSSFIGAKCNKYKHLKALGLSAEDALNSCGIKRLCCRSHVLSVPDFASALLLQPTQNRTAFGGRVVIKSELAVERVLDLA